MEKIKFQLEEDVYKKAMKLKRKLFSNFKEIVTTAIKELYIKEFGEWPPREESVYDHISRKRLEKLRKS